MHRKEISSIHLLHPTHLYLFFLLHINIAATSAMITTIKNIQPSTASTIGIVFVDCPILSTESVAEYNNKVC